MSGTAAHRVLVASFYDRPTVRPALDRLPRDVGVVFADEGRTLTEDELVDRLRSIGADIVIAADEPYTERVLAAAPGLRLIVRDGVGLDSVDLGAASARGVLVCTAPVCHEAVADLAMGLIIAAVRRIPTADRLARSGRWNDRDAFLAADVNGSTLGLVGFGRIGRAVARRAAGFSMRLLAADPAADRRAARRLGVTLTDLDDLLAASHIVSLHVPLAADTRRLLDARRIGLMRPGAVLVNTARGGVVDEPALAAALAGGRLAAAALDVLSVEPPAAENPLLGLENVIVTPHVGSDTRGTFRAVYESAVEDIRAFVAGHVPPRLANPEALRRR